MKCWRRGGRQADYRRPLQPLVERFAMVEEFDRMVVKLLIDQLKAQTKGPRTPLAVNLSSHSIRSEGFDDWLVGLLQTNRDVAPYLIFEVPELTMRGPWQIAASGYPA
ncbi:MAG: EAL domain-containing protein [Gammaproteobacteria bacterium]